MKPIRFSGALRAGNAPQPIPGSGEALIRVVKAGICTTDIEIGRGYMPGFSGVLSHKFFCLIESGNDSSLRDLA